MDTLAAAFPRSRDRCFRKRNKTIYRLAHWPIWIFAFFIVPGPLVFDLFTRGFDTRMEVWRGAVILVTGIAAWHGRLPGTEPIPYILSFTENKPNPLYRRICYTIAWSDLVAFAATNLAGLADAAITGRWHLRQLYSSVYFAMAIGIWLLGALGQLPRTRSSTRGENRERRYFYAAVWAVVLAQTTLALLWKLLPRNHHAEVVKLIAFVFTFAGVASLALIGRLPRTQPIPYPEWAISD